MTQILHRRTGLEKTTLKRGCGGTCHNVLSHMPAPVQDFFHQQYTQKVCKYPNSKRFQKVHTYIHTCIHANKHTYIHTDRQTDIHTYVHTYIHTYIHVCMHTYTHAECVCFDSASTVHATVHAAVRAQKMLQIARHLQKLHEITKKYPETCFFFVLMPKGIFPWYLQRFEPVHCGRALCVHCTCTVRALSKHTHVPS